MFRAMIATVQAINGDHISQLANRGEHHLEVACMTCHAGRPQPATLEQEVTWGPGSAPSWRRSPRPRAPVFAPSALAVPCGPDTGRLL